MCRIGKENVRYSKEKNDRIVGNIVNIDPAKFCLIWKPNKFFIPSDPTRKLNCAITTVEKG